MFARHLHVVVTKVNPTRLMTASMRLALSGCCGSRVLGFDELTVTDLLDFHRNRFRMVLEIAVTQLQIWAFDRGGQQLMRDR
jgi:hypothetical protein